MKILLFGKGGQVGWELQRSLAPQGELIALDFDSTEHCGDFTNLEGVAKTVAAINPDVIVNAAAHTAVDNAESELELARTLNARVPELLANLAKQSNAWLIHYSTDYVFNGSGELPWCEDDATGPLSVYGKTKLEGELAITQSGCRYLIFRTSWVYAARGGNFAKTMLRLAQERDQLAVINDQFGAPTGAELLADITAHCIRAVQNRPELGGLYHVTADGYTTWYDYAKFVIEFARGAGFHIKVNADGIKPISTSAYPVPAKRPNNSRLNSNKLKKAFDLNLPHWQVGVTRMLMEISERK